MNIPNFCLLILVLFTMIFTAGCTSTETPQLPVYASQTPAMHPTGSGTPEVSFFPQSSAAALTPPPVTPVPAVVFSGEYRWAEYRINNTITLPPNPRYQWEYAARIERSYEVYNGTPAIHENVTVTGDYSEWIGKELVTTKNGFHASENMYYERSTKRILGGTFTSSGAGRNYFSETVPEDAVYRGNHTGGWLLISPFEDLNTSLSYDGKDRVTVPAGTYRDARRYTGNFHSLPDFPITFWVAEDIPVPVQYRISNPDLGGEDPVQTFELIAWG